MRTPQICQWNFKLHHLQDILRLMQKIRSISRMKLSQQAQEKKQIPKDIWNQNDSYSLVLDEVSCFNVTVRLESSDVSSRHAKIRRRFFTLPAWLNCDSSRHAKKSVCLEMAEEANNEPLDPRIQEMIKEEVAKAFEQDGRNERGY
ncbi:hypothetical protein L1987_85717 [Smallanthus sonchifolius]|uniref:Uncharacterized protein n=1 Tax=Smallanthus sonchifolius TaxID=185202 RepID=A0ACB8XXC8_9ASTR|nr:hypothetical protein L1987_85717 [Smallanthus sonchifolius]